MSTSPNLKSFSTLLCSALLCCTCLFVSQALAQGLEQTSSRQQFIKTGQFENELRYRLEIGYEPMESIAEDEMTDAETVALPIAIRVTSVELNLSETFTVTDAALNDLEGVFLDDSLYVSRLANRTIIWLRGMKDSRYYTVRLVFGEVGFYERIVETRGEPAIIQRYRPMLNSSGGTLHRVANDSIEDTIH